MVTKTKNKRAASPILASVHEAAADLHKLNLVDKATMREFDAFCLTPVEPLSPAEIRSLREREHVSQPVFAHYLNVRKDAVSKWERGEKGDSSSLFKAISANYEIGVKSSGMAGNGAPEMMKMRTGWLSFKEHVDQRISSSAPILVIQRLGRRSYDCQSP